MKFLRILPMLALTAIVSCRQYTTKQPTVPDEYAWMNETVPVEDMRIRERKPSQKRIANSMDVSHERNSSRHN